MANKTFNTRIKNRIDTYALWTEKNPVLLNGEIAIVVIPAETGAVQDEPITLFKVGDGTSTFNQLAFVGAMAADVYGWAKAKNKPEYQASEIKGLADYISGEIQDSDTQYKIEADAENGRKFYLYSKSIGGEFGTTPVSTIEIPETVYTLDTGSANGTVAFNGADVAVKGLGTAAYKADTEFDAAGAAQTAEANAKLYADGKDTAIAAAKTAGENAQKAVDALADKVGAVTEGKTVVGMIADATYNDTAIKASIKNNTDAIATLNGTSAVDGSVDKKVADAINEFATKVSDDQTINTFKELIDYAAAHKDEYSTLSGEVQTNKTAIATLNGNGAGSVAKAVSDAKTELETSINSHTGNSTIHITAEERIAWNGKTTMSDVEAKGYQTEAQVKSIKVDSAAGADKLNAAVAINLTGGATGTASFDGSEAIDIAVTVADYSHNHTIDNVDGLQDALNTKATPDDITQAINGLNVTDEAEAGLVVSAVSEQNGKINVSRRQVKIDELGQDEYIVFDCGTASTIIG